MNLIKVQEQLNSLPASSQTLAFLQSAAQGMSPMVPPWLALTRMNEINKLMQEGQPNAQPPTESVSESLPKQLAQNMGIMSGMPQAPQGQPAPQGMPQQGGAPMQMGGVPGIPQGGPVQGMPQQAPMKPMAEGGLTSVPVDPRMFNYGSGGIIAFNGESDEQLVDEEDDEEDVGGDILEPISEGSGIDPAVEYRRLQSGINTQLAQQPRAVRSRAAVEKDLGGNAIYGVDEGPIGQKRLAALEGLQKEREAGFGIQKQQLQDKKLSNFWKSLIDAGEATRGQSGIGALLGGFGRSSIAAQEELNAEEGKLREAQIASKDKLSEAAEKYQELRRAIKNGDVAAERKADIELSKIAKDLNMSKNTMLGRMASGTLGLLSAQERRKGMVEAVKVRASGKGAAKEKVPTDLMQAQKIELDALIEGGAPDNAATRRLAMNRAQDRMSKSAGTERVEVSKIDKANTEFNNRMLTDPYLRKLRRTDEKAYDAEVAKMRDEIEKRFGVRPTDEDPNTLGRAAKPTGSGIPSALPKPAASATVPPLPPGFERR